MSLPSCILVSILLLANPWCHDSAAARQPESRMVIATHVACRSDPDATSPAALQYQLGDVFLPRAESESPSGIWYLDTSRVPGAPSPGCWIHGSLTTEWADRERALLAAADRVLGRSDQVPFDDFVAVDNLLVQTPPGAHASTTVLEASPLLQLRRLQVLERAARAPGTRLTEVRRDPLKAAWFFANQDVLRYHEPGGSWVLPAHAYWELHDRHRASTLAEEIAWAAATGFVPVDECDAVCLLSRLNQTYARYWAMYSQGQWLTEALSEAQRRAEFAVQVGCFDGASGVAEQASAIRATLREVASPSKQSLLQVIGEIERLCAA